MVFFSRIKFFWFILLRESVSFCFAAKMNEDDQSSMIYDQYYTENRLKLAGCTAFTCEKCGNIYSHHKLKATSGMSRWRRELTTFSPHFCQSSAVSQDFSVHANFT